MTRATHELNKVAKKAIDKIMLLHMRYRAAMPNQSQEEFVITTLEKDFNLGKISKEEYQFMKDAVTTEYMIKS